MSNDDQIAQYCQLRIDSLNKRLASAQWYEKPQLWLLRSDWEKQKQRFEASYLQHNKIALAN